MNKDIERIGRIIAERGLRRRKGRKSLQQIRMESERRREAR